MDETTGMTERRGPMGSCCATTPSSACFWTAVFLLTYGALLTVRAEWTALTPYNSALLLISLGIACLVNVGRNRTYHCYITGPLFLVAAIVAALIESDLLHVGSSLLGGVVMMGVGVAFVAEWRASRAQQSS
jgi:hypothetical protein